MGLKSLAALFSCGICIGIVTLAFSQQNESAPGANKIEPHKTESERIADLESRVARLEQQLQQLNAKSEHAELQPGLVPFDEAILNLGIVDTDRPHGERYLKISMVFEVENEEMVAKAVKRSKPRLMNSLITIIAEKRIMDLRGSENLQKLRTEIKDEFNAQFVAAGDSEHIKAVLFNELNVQ